MNDNEIEVRINAARRVGNWNEARHLEDLRRQRTQAIRQNTLQRNGASSGNHRSSGFHNETSGSFRNHAAIV